MVRVNFALLWIYLSRLSVIIGVLAGLRYLRIIARSIKEIRDGIRRIVWQSDTVWALTAIEYDIPISASTAAGTEEGERIKNKIISDAKARYKNENGKAKGTAH